MRGLAKALLISGVLLSPNIQAFGQTHVYPGCDAPLESGGGRTFYVDPAKGSPDNDGSLARPWRTLSEVTDAARRLIADKTPAPEAGASQLIKPGDTIVLMGGDHGEVEIRNAVAGDFIQIVAAKDQHPILRRLRLTSASHWLFRGIKIQGEHGEKPSENAPGDSLITISEDANHGSSNNIIFNDVSVSATDDTSSWSPQDWVHRPFATGLNTAARCTTVSDSHFFNLRDSIAIAGDDSLVENNLIERMGNDGIDIMASNLLIRGNTIRDGRHSPAEQLHPDGIQGWTLNGKENHDIVIEGNRILNAKEAGDPEMQGISIFDGKWTRVRVVNNLIVTNHWHGIALYGVEQASVINNTVAPAALSKRPSWITVHNSKDNSPSRHIVVRNNIAASFIIDGEDVEFDHNIAQQRIVAHINGGLNFELSRGKGPEQNSVDRGILNSFKDFDVAAGRFDMRPGALSAATGAGSEKDAPAYDAAGRARTRPVDIGAFSH